MPTGYTAKLVDEGQSFEDFILTCARAFGACVDLRDDEKGRAPRKIKSRDSYYEDQLKASNEILKDLLKMNKTEQKRFCKQEKEEQIFQEKEFLETACQENLRINEMIKKVNDWTPPSPDHNGLKDFMLNQLVVSMNDTSYSEKNLKRLKEKDYSDHWRQEVKCVKEDIKLHTQRLEAEEDTRKDGNDWLEELYRSLGL